MVFVVMFTPYVIIVFVAKEGGGPWVDWVRVSMRQYWTGVRDKVA